MKSLSLSVCLVSAMALFSLAQVKSDEPGTATRLASEPMLGKAPGDVRDDNILKMKLVWCPAGFLTMEQVHVVEEPVVKKVDKADDDDVDPKDEPAPQRRQTEIITPVKVFLTQGYWLGKYEVTQAEWKQVMASEPWKGDRFTKEGGDFPATFVSWNDAVDFCRKLTEQERQAGRLPKDWEYTLPTEAQWERACRARTETRFSFGDDASHLGEYAWFVDNTLTNGENFAHRVGQKKANSWGFYDMHGNVWEWCRDNYTENLPGQRDPEVKSDAKTEEAPRRVLRGGGWRYMAAFCRSGSRYMNQPIGRVDYYGFRVALTAVVPADAPRTIDK
ncbi:MAG: formylglycine-generating enzyme family protein [Planctomycetes bacterium]|nr:formylglycine-generating enzyme family protein [Planctomycetota bacterium]